MENLILTQTIRTMKHHLEHLTLENIEEIEQGQQAYFQLLKALRAVPMPLEPIETTSSHENIVDDIATAPPILEPTTIIVEAEEPAPELKAYKFERRLKGGYLPEINAFVPETKVRILELEHGDMVYASPIPGTEDAPKYVYSKAESKGKPLKDRVCFSYCIVESDSSLNALVVSKTANGKNIRIDEVPQTLLLPENDVQELGVREGDIIDVAYLQSNPNYKKIVWKYDIFELEKDLAKTDAVKSKIEKRDKKEYEPIFKGKTILMLGLEPEQSEFAREIENRGGSFLFLHGREARETMAATFSKADVAIFMLGHVSHHATIWASQFCKNASIPFTGLHTFGKSMFVRTAQDLLTEQDAGVLSHS